MTMQLLNGAVLELFGQMKQKIAALIGNPALYAAGKGDEIKGRVGRYMARARHTAGVN